MECEICRSTQHSRRECPKGDGRGRGPSMHLAQDDSDMQYADWETLLADLADNPTAAANFMVARHLSASISLERCADELFEEIYVGHGE
eukprot:4118417-Pyramimonas_sp.AAC.1